MPGFIDSPLGKMLNRFYTKEGELPKEWQPFLMNRFLSFNPRLRNEAFKIDRYIYKLYFDKTFLKSLIDINIPKHSRMPFNKYIKKTKETEDKYDIILEAFQKKFHWTDKELKTNTKVLIMEVDKNPKRILDYIGADLSVYKKFKIKVVPIKKKEKSLFEW